MASAKSYLLLLTLLPAAASPQAAVPSARAIGAVKALDAAARRIDLIPDGGGSLVVKLTDKTVYLRVPPGEKDLKKAVRIGVDGVSAGDRILARGVMAEDRKSLEAATVIVMTRADLARKHEADRAEWRQRGTAGVVTAVNAGTREITISSGPRDSARVVTVEAGTETRLRRYAPDSIRFADAQPSSFDALKPGDQLRVLGERSADGSRIKAEEIVFGEFRTIAAQVKSVDPATGELRVTDLETHKPLVVRVNADSMLRRIPAGMAAGMARRRGVGANGGAHPPAPALGGPPPGPRGRVDFQQLLERMPALTLAELQPGDVLAISSTAGADPSQVTAIVVVAGIEPLLASAQSGPGMGGLGGALDFEIGLP